MQKSGSRKRHKAARRSTNRVDAIAPQGSVDLAGQFDPGRHESSYTIREFCQAERISKTTFYVLRELGLAPEEIRYGGNIRITYRARLAWQDKMTNLPPEMQAALDARGARRQLQARAAAAKAIESPKHISNPQSPWRRKRAAQAAPPPARFEHKRRGQREAP